MSPALRLVWIRYLFFFFNDTATTEIYTLSLHDALPISADAPPAWMAQAGIVILAVKDDAIRPLAEALARDRKSTRLNSSHGYISYAVFCLKKKKKNTRRKNAGSKSYPTQSRQRRILPIT